MRCSTKFVPRSFADSNNDGVGDLKGITSKMDYLKDLGVDAIWITPCFPSPQVDFGYDVSDYENIDPLYGTLADFDNLVSGAVKRNIRVILDFVVNHSSDQHKWFMASKSARTSEKRDWSESKLDHTDGEFVLWRPRRSRVHTQHPTTLFPPLQSP